MKNILAIATMSLILASCSKDKSTASVSGTGIITANIGGINDTFKTNVVDTITTSYGFYERGLEASSDTGASANRINVVIASLTPLTTGLYDEDSTYVDSRVVLQGGIGYYINNASIANPLNVMVTSISPTAIQGTFYGNIFQSGTDSLVISNGKFTFTK